MYDLTGKRYNKLLVLKEGIKKSDTSREKWWECLCDCGKTVSVRSYSLRIGDTKSCGCLLYKTSNRDKIMVHGMYNTITYHSWEQMKQRCLNPKATRYPSYGAVGITICSQWMEFASFLKDMGERPKGTTLDRINPYGNYEPTNCRWATYKEQSNNQRRHHVMPEEVALSC
jgi:hypothetical protein